MDAVHLIFQCPTCEHAGRMERIDLLSTLLLIHGKCLKCMVKFSRNYDLLDMMIAVEEPTE